MHTDLFFSIKYLFFKKILSFLAFLRYLYTIESYLKVHVLLADTFLSYTSSKINILHIIRWYYSTLLLFL
jgi:hypothetical protein